MEAFHPPDRTEREGEAIAARPSTVCLTGECRGGGSAGRLEEARGSGRKAEIGLREMELANVVVASLSVLVSLCHIGRRDRKLGRDLKEGVLGVWESELVLEEGRFGRVSIRVGEVQALGRVEELLRFLHEARKVQHGGGLVGQSPRCHQDVSEQSEYATDLDSNEVQAKIGGIA